jgi:hypothetical protein
LRTALTAAGFAVESVRPIRHSDWLRSSAKLAVKQGSAGWRGALTWKPLAKLTAAVNYLTNGSDCMMAVAERPA